MNKIQKMLQDLCPNGVEWKTLGECCVFQRGSTITAKDAVEGEVPVIAGGLKPAYYHNVANRTGETITIAGSGAYAGYVSYWDIPIYVSDAFSISPKDETFTVKYLYYFLKNNQEKIHNTKKGSGVPHVHPSSIQHFSIPIPPLEVQVEIVNLLDKFTQLSAELKAELKLRRKQYDYYRNHLLSFDSNSTTVHWMPLGEVAEYAKGRIAIEDIDEINYVSVENLLQDRQGVTIASSIPNMESCIRFLPNDILIGNIRPYLRKIWLADKEGGTNGDVLTVRIKSSYKESLLPRFLYHNLASESFFLFDNQHAKGAKMPRGDKNAVMQYLIPIPPMEEQERIVGILDKFETLVNDLSKGLPAEIALVQKQYEYYRNLLLTFE